MNAPHWPLSLELLRWGNRDPFTLDQACLGMFITGATGSGKTSGPFQYALRAMMRAGFGGIFLCDKIGVGDEYAAMAAAEQRSDVVRFQPGKSSFNFLDYEAKRNGIKNAVISNVVAVFMEAAEVANRKPGQNSNKDPFFENATKQLLSNALEIMLVATQHIDLRQVRNFILALATTRQALADPNLVANQLIMGAQKAAEKLGREAEVALARTYFRIEWPQLANETRTSISATLSVLLDFFLRNPLRDLFLKPSNCTPDDVLRGNIVIVDVPIKEYAEVGKIAGAIWKFCLQRAIERRAGPKDEMRPIFIAADESQCWVTETDASFQETARSSRGVTVYATQSLANYYKELGGGEMGRDRTHAFLGNLQNRLACQNGEDVTNEWFSKSLGQVWIRKKPAIWGSGQTGGEAATPEGSVFNLQRPGAPELVADLRTRAFHGLKMGGERFGYVVEAILTRPGKPFSTGKRWMKVPFKQKIATPGILGTLFGNATVITAPTIPGAAEAARG